jgi:hypothetical protein
LTLIEHVFRRRETTSTADSNILTGLRTAPSLQPHAAVRVIDVIDYGWAVAGNRRQ